MTLEKFKKVYPEGMKFKVLDETYTLHYSDDRENIKLRGAAGIVELYTKEIILDVSETFSDETSMNHVELYWEKVLRHELIHALFHELGLTKYCDDEKLVELLAQKYPSMEKILNQATGKFNKKKKKKKS